MKPNQLYRGVVLTAQQISDLDWEHSDLEVPYEPIIDEQGRKTVLDGNEYGVYMSDNQAMVEQAYGHPRHTTPLENASQLIISGAHTKVGMPQVGVRYEIDTQNLDIREPEIHGAMSGHYNNGYEGKEWIADKIPSESYRVSSIEIGKDMLHDAQTIKITGDDAKEQVSKILAEREARLKELAFALSILPRDKQIRLNSADMDLYKAAFGEDGLARKDLSSFEIKEAKDVFTYIQATICQDQKPGIDMGNIGAMFTLSNRLTNGAPIEQAIDLLQSELEKAKDKREELENADRPTNGINRTISRIQGWLDIADQAGFIQEKEIDLAVLGDVGQKEVAEQAIDLDNPAFRISSDEVNQIREALTPTIEVDTKEIGEEIVEDIGQTREI